MSVCIYPVTQTAFHCEDYTVKQGGKKLPLDTARVSAYPFNRRWPGHQRQIEQSELVNFLSFAMDEPVTLRNIYLNGEKLTSPDQYTLVTDEFCKNIVIE